MLEKERALEFSVMTGRLPTRTETLDDPSINDMPELAGFLEARQTIMKHRTFQATVRSTMYTVRHISPYLLENQP